MGWFDLADAYILSGDVDKEYKSYHDALKKVPIDVRGSVLSSVINPLEELVSIGVVEDQVKIAVQKIIQELKDAIRDADNYRNPY